MIRKERGTGSSGHLSLRVSAPWEESGAESQQELSTLSKGGGGGDKHPGPPRAVCSPGKVPAEAGS